MPFLLLMPSFNQAHFIAEAVQSVISQDDPDWELWILDNSTDHTPEVMRQFDDRRIHFHHVPERMDPGSALNWLLERARGDCFSYLHTDNKLAPNYVRRFKDALRGHELAVAYCDMHLIDDHGKRIELYRRGAFNLPRLLSFDTLGVPFAATTRLVERLGGFSVEDVADDARFCISAYGLAHFIHIDEPLLDYRLHRGSRTKAAGSAGMRRAFLAAVLRAVPALEQRGLAPHEVMAREVSERLSELEWRSRQLWGRLHAERLLSPVQGPGKCAEAFNLETNRLSSPSRPLMEKFLNLDRKRRRYAKLANSVLLPWAHSVSNTPAGETRNFRIQSLNFRTLWAARQLEIRLGWTPLLDPTIYAPPPLAAMASR